MVRLWLARGCADCLARTAVAHALGCPESEVELGREPGGRPYTPGLHLSLSHAGDVAAVAVTTLGPVGVDVEPRRDLPAAALAARWFTPDEASWVAGRPDDFLPLWTRKEAVGKALGSGLGRTGLRRPMPLPPAPTGPSLATAVPGCDGMALYGIEVDGLVLAVACAAPDALGAAVVLVSTVGPGQLPRR